MNWPTGALKVLLRVKKGRKNLWSIAEYATRKYDCSSGHATPKYATLYIDYLSCRHLKKSKHRELFPLNSPHLPEDRFSKRNSVVMNLPRSFSYQGRLILVTVETRQTVSQTIMAPVHSFKGPFIIFPKNLLSPKRPAFPSPLSLLRWYLSPNSKPLLWVLLIFFLGVSNVYELYILINFSFSC